MSGIETFLQNICNLLNRKAILKKCYRSCAILTAGTLVVAIVAFTNTDFGGKNNINVALAFSSGGKNKGEEDSEFESLLAAELQLAEETVKSAEVELAAKLEEQSEERQLLEEPLVNGEEQMLVQEPEEAVLENREIETVAQENVAAGGIAISQQEYDILARIVEAEAGDEDVKGKMLVANVILNRVNYPEFPNTIEGVVFQKKGNRYQFSPIKNGSYYKVTVKDSTYLAVDRVLAGEDESMGALFFCCRAYSDKSNLKWFDNSLVKLFSYGGHEFFTYP